MKYDIETFSLTKIFSDWWGRGRVCAVDKLDLRIANNEVFGLLGPNGSGKTTTIKMLLGLLHPTKGNCIVLGGRSTDPKINSRIGFMPEESYLYKYLNARETLNFYARLFGLPSKIRKHRIESLLDMVGLRSVASRPVGTFSKGMARRIGLAQALINDPDLLILDEPTTGLDPIGTRQIKDLIIQLAKRGKTVLLCSHLLADVEDVCGRIAILYGGKIQSEGQVKNLLQQTGKTQITAGSLSAAAIEKIGRVIKDENVEYEVTCPMDRLETFFIRTVTDAQKQQQSTSGAQSKTDIGDFLMSDQSEDATQEVLDKLVSSPVDSSSDDTGTQDIEVPQPKPEADTAILNKLAKDEPITTQAPVQTDLPQQEIQQEIKTKQDLLDQLTGRTGDEKDGDSVAGNGEDNQNA